MSVGLGYVIGHSCAASQAEIVPTVCDFKCPTPCFFPPTSYVEKVLEQDKNVFHIFPKILEKEQKRGKNPTILVLQDTDLKFII